MYTEKISQPADALLDPAYRLQVQGLTDMTAALNGRESKPVVFSTDSNSIVNRERHVIKPAPIAVSGGGMKAISDDDLCSTCQHRNDGASDLSTCALGWPGQQDADGYKQECASFSEEAVDGVTNAGETPLFVVFEWVYPDEDGHWAKAAIDPITGTITLLQAIPTNVSHSAVRTRIWFDAKACASQEDLPDSAGEGQDFTVGYKASNWVVEFEDLLEMLGDRACPGTTNSAI